jgi:hypothetical protein
MKNDNLGGNKPKPLTTRVSPGRHDDDRDVTSRDHSGQKRPRSNASEQTGGRSLPAPSPVETGGRKTRTADDPVLVTDGGRNQECPECEKILVYRGECAGCGWAADEPELTVDSDTEYFGGGESKTSRALRIAIGATYGRDIRERVNSVGNTAAPVRFRRPLLEEIAEDVLEEENLSELGVRELRARIASALDRAEPAPRFNWLHLRDIYETIVDPEDGTDPEKTAVEDRGGPARASGTTVGPGDQR